MAFDNGYYLLDGRKIKFFLLEIKPPPPSAPLLLLLLLLLRKKLTKPGRDGVVWFGLVWFIIKIGKFSKKSRGES